MLVLQRYPNQSVTITVGGVAIKVIVNQVSGQKVWLGFEAPRHVQIVRDDAINDKPKESVQK